jgi:hypothetical protein
VTLAITPLPASNLLPRRSLTTRMSRVSFRLRQEMYGRHHWTAELEAGGCVSLLLSEKVTGKRVPISADVTASWASGERLILSGTDPGGTGARMIGSVKDSPGDLLPGTAEVTDLSGIVIPVLDLRWSPAVNGSSSSEETPVPRPRGTGRPSTVAPYAPQVAQWLSEDPDLPGAEILRRVRRAGYRGGKSALYELVRRLRVRRPGNRAKSS